MPKLKTYYIKVSSTAIDPNDFTVKSSNASSALKQAKKILKERFVNDWQFKITDIKLIE